MRRTALLLTVVAGLLALPAGALGAPHAGDVELAVPPPRATAHAAAARTPWMSGVVRPGRRFQVFGLLWKRTRADVHAEVRVRAGGRWHRWVAADTADAEGRGTGAIWAGGADAAQVRLSRPVRGLRLHAVAVRGEPRRPHATAHAAADQPTIIPRAQWGGDTQCKPRDTASLGTVQMAFVHHTVSANDYGPQDSAAMVLGICRFHRDGNGWDDIGYNFLVDKYGQIFEGRAGGVDQPVIGAQAQGWNSQSTGVANLGTYQDVPQTDAALEAIARLLAWKLPLHGAPVTGEVTLKSAGGETNRYPAGTLHTFQRISGHRDGDQTECPGAQLYAQLPRLRALTDSRAPDVIPAPQPALTSTAKLSLAAPRLRLVFPEPAQLSGRLVSADGRPIPGQRVRIQVLTAKGFKAVATVTTAADGAFATALPTSRNRSVRALVGRVVSNTIRLNVAPALVLAPTAPRVRAGRRAVLAGTLRPRKGAVFVEAALQTGALEFHRALVVRGRASDGRFRVAVPLRRPGVYRLRVRVAGDRRNAPAQSDVYVRATAPR